MTFSNDRLRNSQNNRTGEIHLIYHHYCKKPQWRRRRKPAAGKGPCFDGESSEGLLLHNTAKPLWDGGIRITFNAFSKQVSSAAGWWRQSKVTERPRTSSFYLDKEKSAQWICQYFWNINIRLFINKSLSWDLKSQIESLSIILYNKSHNLLHCFDSG